MFIWSLITRFFPLSSPFLKIPDKNGLWTESHILCHFCIKKNIKCYLIRDCDYPSFPSPESCTSKTWNRCNLFIQRLNVEQSRLSHWFEFQLELEGLLCSHIGSPKVILSSNKPGPVCLVLLDPSSVFLLAKLS